MNSRNVNAGHAAPVAAPPLTAWEIEHLCEVLRHHPRLIFGMVIVADDSWQLLAKAALIERGAEWLAIPAPDGSVWVFSDADFLQYMPRLASPLPTAAPGLVSKIFRACGGASGWELSRGWRAAVKRAAAMLPADGVDGV